MDADEPNSSTKEANRTNVSQTHPVHEAPGDANPALAETAAYGEGRVSTAEYLLARESEEAQLPGAPHDRDEGLVGGPRFHQPVALPIVGFDPQQDIHYQDELLVAGSRFQSPTVPIAGFDAEDDIYDREETHVPGDEPETHIFAPRMSKIPSEENE